MLKRLLLPLLAVHAWAQDSTVISGTRPVTGAVLGAPATENLTYIDYGTTIIYNNSPRPSQNASTATSASNSTAPMSSALIGTVSQNRPTATNSASRPTNTVSCNGYPEFCNRKYSNITMITAHNSPFHIPSNLASNQDFGVIAQLNDGIRMVQGQTHFVDGIPHLCHTSCDLLDAGPLTDWLSNITAWLRGHPYDVVTILIGNGDYTPISNFTSFFEQSGIVEAAYVPPQIPMNLTSWPTLGEMIIGRKRAVIFMDYEANQTEVPYVLDEFSQLSETPFDPTDPTFPCTVDRPPDLPMDEAKQRLYMINHNLNAQVNLLGLSVLVPNLSNIATTNGLEGFSSAGLSANQCISNFDRPPNFINVDYYNMGSPYNGSIFGVAAEQNNVGYNSNKCCGMDVSISAANKLLSTNGGAFAVAMAVAVGVLSLF